MLKLMRLIKRPIKIYLAKKSKRYSNRIEDRAKRISIIREMRSNMIDDLMVGYKLKEFGIDMEMDYKKFLYELNGLTYTVVLELYKKYRGFKISEHPQIYNRSHMR